MRPETKVLDTSPTDVHCNFQSEQEVEVLASLSRPAW